MNGGRSRLISYRELVGCWRRGLNNGNWHRLSLMDRIFYRATVFFARTRGRIVNNTIISHLRGIVEKLRNKVSSTILKAGLERAREILFKFTKNGVLKWAPQLKTWLADPKYLFWLGLNSQPPHSDWPILHTRNSHER